MKAKREEFTSIRQIATDSRGYRLDRIGCDTPRAHQPDADRAWRTQPALAAPEIAHFVAALEGEVEAIRPTASLETLSRFGRMSGVGQKRNCFNSGFVLEVQRFDVTFVDHDPRISSTGQAAPSPSQHRASHCAIVADKMVSSLARSFCLARTPARCAVAISRACARAIANYLSALRHYACVID